MQNRGVLGLNPTGGYDLNGSAGQIVCAEQNRNAIQLVGYGLQGSAVQIVCELK